MWEGECPGLNYPGTQLSRQQEGQSRVAKLRGGVSNGEDADTEEAFGDETLGDWVGTGQQKGLQAMGIARQTSRGKS